MGGTELEKVRAFLGKSNHPESVVSIGGSKRLSFH